MENSGTLNTYKKRGMGDTQNDRSNKNKWAKGVD